MAFHSAGMEISREILTSIVTLARLIRTEADKRARAYGMTRAQWHILIQLERKPGMLQKELAETLEVEPITVARLVDRLEAKGMVERRADPTDRRCWRLHLTGNSIPLLHEANTQLNDLANTLCGEIAPSDRVVVVAAMTHMRQRVSQELRNTPAYAG